MDVVHVRGVRTTGYSSKFGFALTFALVSIQTWWYISRARTGVVVPDRLSATRRYSGRELYPG